MTTVYPAACCPHFRTIPAVGDIPAWSMESCRPVRRLMRQRRGQG